MRYHGHPRRPERPERAEALARRRPSRRPSYRSVVTVAGAATAVLTVATGVYLAASPAPGPPAAAPTVAPSGADPSGAGPSGADPSGSDPTVAAPTAAAPTAAVAAVAEPAPPQRVPQGAARAAEAPKGEAAGFVQDVVGLVNAEREKAGCGSLREEPRLRAAAQKHADDMSARDYYAHDSPEGRNGGDRMSDAGYEWSAWAENIHRGPKAPSAAMADWMESSGHRANILNCAFKDVGVGVALGADGPWWVQTFGAKR
ncbi:CAP domain-containing protein [Streptomyces sp. NPDC012693]|uniref:CAP domain-containing protein n=1 Tax=Streptomyces sp. NPDC012693 TaxID=3364844 RepID=UPI00368413ED